MTDNPVELDQHRNGRTKGNRPSTAADTSRRQEHALRAAQDELEKQLIAAPASDWQEAADKARYC